MPEEAKSEVLQGTLDLMVLKTLDALIRTAFLDSVSNLWKDCFRQVFRHAHLEPRQKPSSPSFALQPALKRKSKRRNS